MSRDVPNRAQDRRRTIHAAQHPLSVPTIHPTGKHVGEVKGPEPERNHSAPRHRAEAGGYNHTGFEAGAL
jgi:hypothetical protein